MTNSPRKQSKKLEMKNNKGEKEKKKERKLEEPTFQ